MSRIRTGGSKRASTQPKTERSHWLSNSLRERNKRTRLVRELAKLDPQEENQLADEGLGDPGARILKVRSIVADQAIICPTGSPTSPALD